jgi:O-succinylbenzoate synthase
MPGRLRAYARRVVGDALLEAELLRVRLPLVAPFRTAHTTTAVKEALLVRVRTSAGIGWGECTASIGPEYDGETIDGSRLALRDHLLPRAFAGADLGAGRGHRAARAALACALLDARLRAEGIALARWLGATTSTVAAGVAVGMTEDLDDLRAAAAAYVGAGYRRIKCKIEPGHDTNVLGAVRAEVGPDVDLAADANGSYDLERARRLLEAVDALALQFVEQPCAPDAIEEHAALVDAGATPICLDESITGGASAEAAIARKACNAIAIKVGRLGIDGARHVHDVCVANAIGAVPGGMLETGIGRAALLAVAALPGFTLTGDCSASARFFGADGDITEPFTIDQGRLRVPTGPGLGVEPLPDRLARCTIARETITDRG